MLCWAPTLNKNGLINHKKIRKNKKNEGKGSVGHMLGITLAYKRRSGFKGKKIKFYKYFQFYTSSQLNKLVMLNIYASQQFHSHPIEKCSIS